MGKDFDFQLPIIHVMFKLTIQVASTTATVDFEMDFSDTMILCRRPIVVANKTLSVLICLIILRSVFMKE